MFPLDGRYDDGATIVRIIAELKKICESAGESIYSGDSGGGQYDNAASDGASLAMIHLAIELLEREIRKEKAVKE